MAWTAPATWVSGAILTAAQLNEQVRDNELMLAPFFTNWTAFTPQLRTATTNRTSTVTSARYLRVGSMLLVNATVVATAGGGANERINLALPTGFTYTRSAGDNNVVGTFQISDAGVGFYIGTAIHQSSGYIYGIGYGGNDFMGTSAPAITMATNDVISYNIAIEINN